MNEEAKGSEPKAEEEPKKEGLYKYGFNPADFLPSAYIEKPAEEKVTAPSPTAPASTPAPAGLPETSAEPPETPPVVLAPDPAKPEYIATAGAPLAASETPALRKDIVPFLEQVTDPEIGMNILDMGLLYWLEVDKSGNVYGEMSVTAPACPFMDTMPQEAANSLAMAKGVGEVKIKLVWNPAWTFDMLSDAAKLKFDMF